MDSMVSRRTLEWFLAGALALVCSVVPAGAQAPAPAPVPDPHAGHTMPMPGMSDMPADDAMLAMSLFPARDASGTAWLPDASPMYGVSRQTHQWAVMLHGNGFLQYLQEFAPEPRGAHQAGSINWFMVMARRSVGAGRIGVRTMFSLEPWTIRGCGYPDLLATGELCDGDDIHDRQHPHDLFMEAAVEYDRPVSSTVRWQIYGGPAGEPALGPAAFPHRLSAMPNPIAPITHHWLDATHVSYGVVTSGVYGNRWKAEASLFNGREPDERRTDFDLAALDSVSARLSWLPTASLVMQVSAGHLNDAEPVAGGSSRVDVKRVTASATYVRASGDRWLWATTAGWGSNLETGSRTHGLLVESAITVAEHHTWFGRVEVNGKPAHALHIHESNGVFTVAKMQVGYTRYLTPRHGLQPGLGGFLSAAIVPADLQPRYGGVGTGLGLFLTLRPGAHGM